MYQYLLYIILFIIIVILCIAAYIKIKYRFWCMQPVFHIYDFQYYLFPPGIIKYELPEKNKYCNFKNIETIKFDNISEIKTTQLVNFIQTHYLQNKENKFIPKKENIIPYFQGHQCASLISFYYEDELLMDLKKGTTNPNTKIVSIMTTRPIHININNGSKDAFFDAYYVDYLCVDKSWRKKGIAPQVIQTHHYNQRHINRKIQVSLFKREDELTGIVPLCVYNTYGFDMIQWNKTFDLAPYYSLIECGPSNIHHLIDFMKINTNKFEICIMVEISNIMELIKTCNIYVYMIIQKQEQDVLCAYFFRKSCTMIKKDSEALSCFASINNCQVDELFIHGYKVALSKICEKKNDFKFAVLEDISDNNILIQNLKLRTVPFVISPTAFFFYNFAYHTFNSNKVLVIC